MLKQGKQLGLVPIKCDNREGTDKLKELHYRINDILYTNSGKYIDRELADSIYTDLCELGKAVDGLEVPDRAKAKKSEILSKLRIICKGLKEYKKEYQTIDDAPLMQKAINWFIHQYIDAKQNDKLTDELAVSMVKESKRLYLAYLPYESNLKLDTLVKINGELAGYFDVKYGIRH